MPNDAPSLKSIDSVSYCNVYPTGTLTLPAMFAVATADMTTFAWVMPPFATVSPFVIP